MSAVLNVACWIAIAFLALWLLVATVMGFLIWLAEDAPRPRRRSSLTKAKEKL